MLKSGSDMMAAAESEVHSLEEFEALTFLSLVKSIPQKITKSQELQSHIESGLLNSYKLTTRFSFQV